MKHQRRRISFLLLIVGFSLLEGREARANPPAVAVVEGCAPLTGGCLEAYRRLNGDGAAASVCRPVYAGIVEKYEKGLAGNRLLESNKAYVKGLDPHDTSKMLKARMALIMNCASVETFRNEINASGQELRDKKCQTCTANL